MSFPQDIKNAMRDCALKLFWAKKDIVNFLANNGCNSSEIKKLGNYKELTRAGIVDTAFDNLSKRADEGLGQFRAMLQSLINWSHFDSYYFDTLKKLDRNEAERAIDHLKQLQELRDDKIKKEKAEREKKEEESQKPLKTISDLKKVHLDLLQGKVAVQKRGYELERILQELSKISGLQVTEPFRVSGEQIDGAIKFDGEHYIVEAKWQDKESANEPVYQFAGKVEGKMYGRGLFVSINGFSENVIKSLVIGKAIRTIFIDGGDLMLVFENYLTFADMIDKKVKAAQTKGHIYVHPITGKEKVKC